jgi:AraC-like DNA-binding protein
MERVSDAILTGLLFAQRHNRSQLLRKANRDAGPNYVRQAEEFIEAHCHEEIDSQRIAEVTGVSLSSLYEGFRRHRSYTPMRFLKLVRLRRARDELLLASPDCTITRVAAKWGFLHICSETEILSFQSFQGICFQCRRVAKAGHVVGRWKH